MGLGPAGSAGAASGVRVVGGGVPLLLDAQEAAAWARQGLDEGRRWAGFPVTGKRPVLPESWPEISTAEPDGLGGLFESAARLDGQRRHGLALDAGASNLV